MRKEKICVYTCITGNYDNLQEIEKKEELDYYCFTNNKRLTSNTWNIIYIQDDSLSNVELARKIKILGHPIVNKYDIAVWIDGSVKFNKPIKDFVKTYFKEKDIFSAFKHAERENIKEECYECVRKRKENKQKVKRLLAFYKKEKYDFQNGLIESTVYIKRPNKTKVKETMELWFYMIKNYSHRDQLSFNYCASKTKLRVHWIDLKVFNNYWFSCSEHGNDKKIGSFRVYFDDGKQYNLDHDFSGNMKEIEKNTYQIKLKIPCDTKKTVVELSRIQFLQLSNLKINSIKKLKIYYFNAMEKENKILFINENPAFEIYNSFTAQDYLEITMKLESLKSKDTVKEIYDSVKYLEEKNSKLQEQIVIIKNQNKDITNQINQIRKRKMWKIISIFDKIVRNRRKDS